jgi:hypothetical protein
MPVGCQHLPLFHYGLSCPGDPSEDDCRSQAGSDTADNFGFLATAADAIHTLSSLDARNADSAQYRREVGPP